ncbi:hypothetical protein RB653_007444 [Dictyostelium firmibasis]|uniref:Polycomb protein EED-like insertion domain-containing protein n=1 Tax=Dictyostelium firmibasis TaxID=79012 RepID=A0AAN7U3N9_9MYCE
MSIINQKRIQREKNVENIVKKTLIGLFAPLGLILISRSGSLIKSSMLIGGGIGFGMGYNESYGKSCCKSSCTKSSCSEKKACPVTNNNNDNNDNNNNNNNTTSTTTPKECCSKTAEKEN